MVRCKDLKSYYNTLDLPTSATIDDIKKNYKRLAMIYHPDRSDGDKTKEEHFKKIQEAYSVLSNESTKRMYDNDLIDEFGNVMRESDASMFPDGFVGGDNFQHTFVVDLNDIFMNMFGFENHSTHFDVDSDESARQHSSRETNCVSIDVDLTLDDVIHGCQPTVRHSVVETCSQCWGEGILYRDIIKCVSCNGRGFNSSIPFPVMCTSCEGKAVIKRYPKTCSKCDGKGEVVVEKEYTLDVPPGQANRSTVSVDKQTKVSFRHVMNPRFFKLDGKSIWIVEYIKIEELLCGFEKDVVVSSKEEAGKMTKDEYFDINEVYTLEARGVNWASEPRGDVKVKFKLERSDKEPELRRYNKVFRRMFAQSGGKDG